jgi:DNA-binding MarR family transcriptional regulator
LRQLDLVWLKEMVRNTTISKKNLPGKSVLDKPSRVHSWTFLSNHSHVIICLARDPEIRMRDVAELVGITERAAIRIVTELEEAGYISKERVGRRNHYSILSDKNLRHPLEAHHSIRTILALARR